MKGYKRWAMFYVSIALFLTVYVDDIERFGYWLGDVLEDLGLWD